MADPRPEVRAHQPESTGDNLRVYLKEMGSVPLLTRKSEIVLCRKIEFGMRRVTGSLAQCLVVEEELPRMNDQIRRRSVGTDCDLIQRVPTTRPDASAPQRTQIRWSALAAITRPVQAS
jgi:hypothetical protein